MIFGTRAYSGPYRNVEKGVMLFYVLVKGVSVSDMAQYTSKTSFHSIHKEFYTHSPAALDRLLATMLSEMFSTLRSRHLVAQRNPKPFKNVTLNLDGHDSRIVYVNAEKASLYSYKLKKSGFRLQVCADMDNMVLFVSAPALCRDYNDGAMLLRMGIQSKIHKLDCIALDGGYSLFISKLVDTSDELQEPFRRLQSTFTKFNHTVVNKVAYKEAFGVQYKLACLLMNIKRFTALRNIPTEQHHTFWLQDGFDYPSKTEGLGTTYTLPKIQAKLSTE
ncbi:hypothetical protein BGZ98_007578 [Dissophora globulifera]|nr:hypothetical protein BGZ98_007578 [Dissophora globulifera]